HRQLRENLELFTEKWGAEQAAGYRLPEPPPPAPPAAVAQGGATPAAHAEAAHRTEPAPEERARPQVSLCLIVKDEEAHLGRCLRSVADLVDELIVVDTGSADRTREVAAACGAQVHDFAWADSFAAARNESLRHARGRWILWLDGDEYLDAENRARLRAVLAG